VPEKEGWVSAHYRQPYHSRRVAKLPEKLKKLGILGLPPSTRVLDACCGGGEAMEALRVHGFERIWGTDSLPQSSWQTSAGRFAASDVRRLPFASDTFEAVVNLHALHHLENSNGVRDFLDEAFRVLRPGGRLFIIDFPATPQIRFLFWAMRNRLGLLTGGLRNFAEIVDEEWEYLSGYLNDWPRVQRQLRTSGFEVAAWKSGLFLFYLCLEKPASVR
jgi:ubiquinone/menaquinone biosynthesis C-methylase UbiE